MWIWRFKETMLEGFKDKYSSPPITEIFQHFWIHDLKSWILSSEWMKELMWKSMWNYNYWCLLQLLQKKVTGKLHPAAVMLLLSTLNQLMPLMMVKLYLFPRGQNLVHLCYFSDHLYNFHLAPVRKVWQDLEIDDLPIPYIFKLYWTHVWDPWSDYVLKLC